MNLKAYSLGSELNYLDNIISIAFYGLIFLCFSSYFCFFNQKWNI